jgi:hypothetical protein
MIFEADVMAADRSGRSRLSAMALNAQKKRTEAIDTMEKAIELGLGRQRPYAEALLRN